MAIAYEIAADFGAILSSSNDFLKNFQGNPSEK